MGFFKKKADPISERSRALKSEIAELESKIKKLSSRVEAEPVRSRGRSTALPVAVSAAPSVDLAVASEPVFEPVNQKRLKLVPEPVVSPEFYNEQGVRKYDLPALLRKLQNQFRAKPAANPKLVTFLAAGSIQGLRPLRYEKRVARNRFIFLTAIFLLILWGVAAVFLKQH